MLNKELFQKSITELGLAFNINFNIYQKEVWYHHLKELNDDEFMKKIKYYIENYNIAPHISDILNIKLEK